MEIQQIQQVRKYLDIIVRRKALIAFFILLGAAAGLAYYLSQPKIYTASTLLSYQQQKINPARMSPDEQARIRDIVSTLTQIVTSNSSLEKIVKDLDLYATARQYSPLEDVLGMMRKNIDIQPSGRGDTFRIAFTGTQQDMVPKVANALASRFIEENMKYREEKASETFSYTKNELQMAKEILDEKEAVMRDYKLNYFNEMPEQRANNMARLNALQEQYQNRQDSIQDLERTRVLIQDQIAARKQIVEENEQLRQALVNNNPAAPAPVETRKEKIERMKRELLSLQDRYTEKHPAIIQLKRQISRLEQSEAESSENNLSTANTVESSEKFDQTLFDLQIQLKEIKLNIQRLSKEMDDLKVLIDKYEKWVEAAPVRGAEWSALTREYGELKRHYDYLVAQNLQARSALNLERKQKGSQFNIEDLARPPETPISPNFLRIMGMALLAGAGLGGGLALTREILDSSFKDPSEVEGYLNTELICTVPQVYLKREANKKLAINLFGITLFVLGSAVVLAAFFYFYRIGKIVL